jgi:hypothetical protein
VARSPMCHARDSRLWPSIDSHAMLAQANNNLSPVKKQKGGDLGLGDTRWGNRLGGMPQYTFDKIYLPPNGPLSEIQHQALSCAYCHVCNIYGHRKLSPDQLPVNVAHIFNSWHAETATHNGYGFGGKIQKKRTAAFLKAEGNQLTQGNLGARLIPQPCLPMPAPAPASGCSSATSTSELQESS